MASSEASQSPHVNFLTRVTFFAICGVGAAAFFWLNRVNSIVPDPYLDEVFHVRQAQVYCAGKFSQWDPKITTPPGLYLISWVLHKLGFACTTTKLRSVGFMILSYYIGIVALDCRIKIRRDALGKSKVKPTDAAATRAVLRDLHTVVNICLFPPLFFFSALYYTDVASTFFVLLSFQNFLNRHETSSVVSRDVLTVLLGLLALLFRQTNIFWVAVFPAGIAAVDLLKSDFPKTPVSTKKQAAERTTATGFWDFLDWKKPQVYDLSIEDAYAEDYLKVVISLLTCAVSTPTTILKLLRHLLPYLTLLAAFGMFVLWNGGVVLGDKSNHVATIHLPQLLYIWPTILFFSFPLALPPLLATLRHPQQHVPRPLPLAALLALPVAALAAHPQTHPFTLADNRHYPFYLFRHLRRHAALRFLVSPLYAAAAWAVARISRAVSVSTAIVWLLVAAAQLASTQLVEPRYAIVPWVLWRMHVGVEAVPAEEDTPSSSSPTTSWPALLWHGAATLWLETAWFLAVSAATGYVFLYWGFAWPQEPGRVQRFMW